MAANYSHNGHLFIIQGGSLVLRVQNDEGRYEVASFLKFIESAENFKVAASVTNLTLVGRNRPLKGGNPDEDSDEYTTEPLNIGLLQGLLRTLYNLRKLTLRDLWVYGGCAPYAPHQFSIKTLSLDNVHCFWVNRSVDIHLILSLFIEMEKLAFESLPAQCQSSAQAVDSEEGVRAYEDFVKATKNCFLPQISSIAIHTQGPKLRTCIAPILSIFRTVTSWEVNCRDEDDLNSVAILLEGGVGKQLTWFALDLSTLQFPNAHIPTCDLRPVLQAVVERLQGSMSALMNLRCFTLRTGSVSRNAFDPRTPATFIYLAALVKFIPADNLRHFTLDFDTYNHCPEYDGVRRHEIEGLPNSWSAAFPLTMIAPANIWAMCRHFPNLKFVELLWAKSPMEKWSLETREQITGYMHEFTHMMRGTVDSCGAYCADPRCVRE